ncbi:MAG: NUDIX domain-containing protein [Acidimicrobiia bacterium]
MMDDPRVLSTAVLPKQDPSFDPRAVALRDAATVMLVRDASRGPEVFMLRRSTRAGFVAGAHVFPGGAVDPSDASAHRVVRGRTATEIDKALGIECGGLSFWLAVVRECFEEAGVLLARRDDGSLVGFADELVRSRFDAARAALNNATLDFAEFLEVEGLHINASTIHYASHWITPIGENRRFDTRFFVARAPEEQHPLHDDRETIASCWVRPADALDMRRRGEIDLILPTIMSLQLLAEHDSADAILDSFATLTRRPAILPQIVYADGVARLLLPGEAGYDERMANGA